jgi:glutathione S-transferase
MKLYSMAGTCALSVHIALLWANADHTLVMLARGDNRNAEFLAINPTGQVPAIVLDDGTVLTEAAAILTWIIDSHPHAMVGPRSDQPLERFRVAQALAMLTSEVHAAFGPFFAPARFLDDEATFAALRRQSLQRVAGHLAAIDAGMAGKQWLVNDRRSVADAYLYVITRWADNLPGGIGAFANLARFRDAMEADSDVAGALAAQELRPLGAG